MAYFQVLEEPLNKLKIQDICNALGWPKEDAPKRGSHSHLTRETAKFRKEFCLRAGKFPLDFKHPQVSRCARLFCEKDIAIEWNSTKGRFFPSTPQRELGLPKDQAA